MRETQNDDEAIAEARHKEAVREGTQVALRVAAIWLPISAALLVGGIYLATGVFEAADALMTEKGFHWGDSLMPMVLFGMFGGCAGLMLGWRMTATSGLVGFPAMKVGAISVLILSVVGLVACAMMFEAGIPGMAWAAMTAVTAAALGGVSFFSLGNR